MAELRGALLLVRHGESEANASGHWAGQADSALTETGQRQARELGERLQGVAFRWVVSSDLRRAAKTAELVLPFLGMESAQTDARLRERHSTSWTGLTHDAIEARWPGHLAAWRTGERRDLPGETETWTEFRDRIREVIVELLDQVGPGLVIAHAGVFRAIEDITGVANLQIENSVGRWLRNDSGGRIEVIDGPDLPS